jgi:hypothetical protein
MGKGREEEPKASQRTHGKYSGSRSDSSSVSKRTSGYKGKTRAKKGARGR